MVRASPHLALMRTVSKADLMTKDSSHRRSGKRPSNLGNSGRFEGSIRNSTRNSGIRQDGLQRNNDSTRSNDGGRYNGGGRSTNRKSSLRESHASQSSSFHSVYEEEEDEEEEWEKEQNQQRKSIKNDNVHMVHEIWTPEENELSDDDDDDQDSQVDVEKANRISKTGATTTAANNNNNNNNDKTWSEPTESSSTQQQYEDEYVSNVRKVGNKGMCTMVGTIVLSAVVVLIVRLIMKRHQST